MTRLEDPKMELVGTAKSHVVEDQAIIFKVNIWNMQNIVLPILVQLEVILGPSSNQHDLRLEMFGSSLHSSHRFNLDGSKPIEDNLIAHSGPVNHTCPH